MLRLSRPSWVVKLQSATFVENPVNRVASVTLQLARTSPEESYGFAFRKSLKQKGGNLKLSQVPHFLAEASPILDALFPDKGRIYAGSSVFLTSVNGISASDHKAAVDALHSGRLHHVNLSVHMGARRTVKKKRDILVDSYDEVDEDFGERDFDDGEEESPENEVAPQRRAATKKQDRDTTNVDAAVAAVLQEMASRNTAAAGGIAKRKTRQSRAQQGDAEAEDTVNDADEDERDADDGSVGLSTAATVRNEVAELKEMLARSVAAMEELQSSRWRKQRVPAAAKRAKRPVTAAAKKAAAKAAKKAADKRKKKKQKTSAAKAKPVKKMQKRPSSGKKRTAGSGQRGRPRKPILDDEIML